MVLCKSCGKENPQGALFCNNCAKQLEPPETKACPACAAQNPSNMVYCGQCGAALDAGKPVMGATDAQPKAVREKKEGGGLPSRFCRHCGHEVGIWDTECPNCHQDPFYVSPALASGDSDYYDDSYSLATRSSGGLLIAGGVFAILAGLAAFGQGILYTSVSSIAASYVPTGSLCLCGGLDILFGLASIAAGVLAFRRSNFGLALFGSILGMIGFGFILGSVLGLIAVILIALSRSDFSD